MPVPRKISVQEWCFTRVSASSGSDIMYMAPKSKVQEASTASLCRNMSATEFEYALLH